MPGDPSETADAIHRFKEEIDNLNLQQTEALKMAIYLGMTPAEVQARGPPAREARALCACVQAAKRNLP